MKENLKGFLKSEKVKGFFKKVFSKKIMVTAIVGIVLITALRIGFCLMFEVQGNVIKVEGNNIVVANFFYTKTVDLGELKLDNNKIQVGEKIKIRKNLSGDIISIQGAHGKHDGMERGQGRPGDKKGPGSKQFGGKKEAGKKFPQNEAPGNPSDGKQAPGNPSGEKQSEQKSEQAEVK